MSRDVRGDEELAEGLWVFAQDQKELQLKLKLKFEAVWKTPLEKVERFKDLDIEKDNNDSSDDSDSSDDEGDTIS